MKIKKIRRNMTNRVLGGVCSGIGQAYDFNPLWLRLLLVISTIYFFPWVIIVYFLAAIVIPKENVAFEDIKYKRYYRIKNHKILGGVCTGLQDYLNIDVVLIRLLFLILLFTFGGSVLVYLILWIVSPTKELKKQNINSVA